MNDKKVINFKNSFPKIKRVSSWESRREHKILRSIIRKHEVVDTGVKKIKVRLTEV